MLGARGAPRAPKPQAAKVGGRHRPDRTGAIGRPVDGGVVDHDDHAIAALVHVELDEIAAERDGALEREQAVLRPEGTAAAVRRDARHFSVSIRPFTNHRCMATMIATGGSRTIMAAAIATFHSGSCEVRGIKPSIPIPAVRISWLIVIMSGQR